MVLWRLERSEFSSKNAGFYVFLLRITTCGAKSRRGRGLIYPLGAGDGKGAGEVENFAGVSTPPTRTLDYSSKRQGKSRTTKTEVKRIRQVCNVITTDIFTPVKYKISLTQDS